MLTDPYHRFTLQLFCSSKACIYTHKGLIVTNNAWYYFVGPCTCPS